MEAASPETPLDADAKSVADTRGSSPMSHSKEVCRTPTEATLFNGDAQLPSGPLGMRVLVERRTVVKSCEKPPMQESWGSPVFLWNPTLGDGRPSPDQHIEFLDLPVVEAAGRCPADEKVYPVSRKTCPDSNEALAIEPGVFFEHEYHFTFEAPGYRARRVIYLPGDWWPQNGANAQLLFAPDFGLVRNWDAINPRLEAASISTECLNRRWREVSREITSKRQLALQAILDGAAVGSPLADQRFRACTTQRLEQDEADAMRERWSDAGESGLSKLRAHFGFSPDEWSSLQEEVRCGRTTWYRGL